MILCGILVFTSTILAGPASATSKCKHLGDTQTIAGKSQVCKKVSGKLAWVKVARPIEVVKPRGAATKSWVEYKACMDSYKSSPTGAIWGLTSCDGYDPHGSPPIKSWAEFNACQQSARDNPAVGMFEDCSPWQP